MDKSVPIPDLRFENSFLRSLQLYASLSYQNGSKRHLSNAELRLVDEADATQDSDISARAAAPAPLEPITPSIVIYAILKDIMLRPLIEGFSWAMLVLLFRPTLRLIQAQGYQVGSRLAGIFGRGNLHQKSFRRNL